MRKSGESKYSIVMREWRGQSNPGHVGNWDRDLTEMKTGSCWSLPGPWTVLSGRCGCLNAGEEEPMWMACPCRQENGLSWGFPGLSYHIKLKVTFGQCPDAAPAWPVWGTRWESVYFLC